MGCGKSTVVAEFSKLGIPTFVADRAGTECYNDSGFLTEVRALLGDDVFLPNGKVDKRLIADKVFADKHLLSGLNNLVHPRVMKSFELFCEKHSQAPYVLFESAILYDYGFDRLMDCVVCVYLQLEERLDRLVSRDHASHQELMARIANQMPAEEMMKRADYVILNYEGNPRQRQVAYIDQILRQ